VPLLRQHQTGPLFTCDKYITKIAAADNGFLRPKNSLLCLLKDDFPRKATFKKQFSGCLITVDATVRIFVQTVGFESVDGAI
jgi:hypothetical protein